MRIEVTVDRVGDRKVKEVFHCPLSVKTFFTVTHERLYLESRKRFDRIFEALKDHSRSSVAWVEAYRTLVTFEVNE